MGALLTGLCPAVHGCVDVNGGAVELSWSLRRFDGARIDCELTDVARMQLWWQVGPDGAMDYRSWPCDQRSAVTDFGVPAGDALLWVRPACDDDNAPGATTYVAPPPIARRIVNGEVVTLSTVLVTVRNECLADDGSDCACRTSEGAP